MTPSQPSETSAGTGDTLLRAADDRVRYAVGNPHFRGRTAVELRGDGSVTASLQREAEIDSYTLQLPPADFTALRSELIAADPRSLRSARTTAQPGEGRVQIDIDDAGGNARVEAWYGEQWTNPALKALIALFSALAVRASGGKIAD